MGSCLQLFIKLEVTVLWARVANYSTSRGKLERMMGDNTNEIKCVCLLEWWWSWKWSTIVELYDGTLVSQIDRSLLKDWFCGCKWSKKKKKPTPNIKVCTRHRDHFSAALIAFNWPFLTLTRALGFDRYTMGHQCPAITFNWLCGRSKIWVVDGRLTIEFLPRHLCSWRWWYCSLGWGA